MKITNEGIYFTYRGVQIRYNWPILQTYFYQSRFIIPILLFESNSIFKCFTKIKELHEDSWEFIKSKVIGFRFEDITTVAAKSFFKNKSGIAITNVNVQAKSSQFWASMPKEYIKHFLNDVVFITCNSPEEVSNLMFSIPENFGQATGYCNGVKICDNSSL